MNTPYKMFITTFTIAILLNLDIQYSIAQKLQWQTLPGVPASGRYDDIYFINESTGWTGVGSLVYKTTDKGNSWVSYTDPRILSIRCIGFFDENIGLIGRLWPDSSILRTTNGGMNWIPVSNISGALPLGICGISILNETTAFCTGSYQFTGRAYRTTDKGQSWVNILNDSSKARTLVDCYFWSADSGIVVGGYSPAQGFSYGYSVVLKTTNGGVTWQRTYMSTRNREWCWKISFISHTTGFVSVERPFSGVSNILKTTNGGDSWTEIPFMFYDQEGIGFLNENTGWVGGYHFPVNNVTYETTNGGLEWHEAPWSTNLNRVRFINDTLAYASGSRIYRYSNEPVGIAPINTEIPEGFRLSQNYPNPFNPVTVIEFDLPARKNNGMPVQTTLKVHDMLGKELYTIMNENLSPGKYVTTFDAMHLSSGIYFYRLISGDYTDSKRMVVLK